MTCLQKTIAGLAVATVVGTGVFMAHQTSKLRAEVQALRQQQTVMTEQIHRFEQGRRETKRQIMALSEKPSPDRSEEAAAIPPSGIEKTKELPSPMLEDDLRRAYDQPTLGKREAALEQLSRSISPVDIPRALAFLATRPGMNGVESPLFSELASRWASKDPNAAVAWAAGLPDATAQKAALLGALAGWTHQSPDAAANYAAALPAGDLQDASVMKVIDEWSFADPGATASWVAKFPAGKLRDKAMGPILFWGQGRCPGAIADMLDAFGNDDLIREHGEQLAIGWLRSDEKAARIWIQHSPLSDEVKQRLLQPPDEAK